MSGAEGLHEFPERITVRDTKVFADEGQRIYSTATGHGYQWCEYVRADLCATPPQSPVTGAEVEPVAWACLKWNRRSSPSAVEAAEVVGDAKPAIVKYTNWRGEHSTRTIYPRGVWYGVTDWHPGAALEKVATAPCSNGRSQRTPACICLAKDGASHDQ
jgi:hypothetical protein